MGGKQKVSRVAFLKASEIDIILSPIHPLQIFIIMVFVKDGGMDTGENVLALDNDLIIGQPSEAHSLRRNHRHCQYHPQPHHLHPQPHHRQDLGERRLLVGFNDLIITG